MNHSFRTAIHRRGVLVAAGTAVVLAAGGGAVAASAATPSPAASSSSASSRACTVHVGALVRALPADLKADLKALRQEPKGQRADDRKALRQKALTGAYGARAESVAHLFGRGRAEIPAALKADLKTLRGMTAKSDERRAEAQRIVAKAESGGYGADVQARAKAAQERVAKRCAAG